MCSYALEIMPFHQVTLNVLAGIYAVCRLEADSPIPPWATNCEFFSITRTGDELSVVVREDAVPDGVVAERDWGCLRVAGTVPFSTIGMLASLTATLAASGISVFALSTFDTDYLLVKQTEMTAAVDALRGRGYVVE
jgi:hypothetical protein